MSESTSQKKGSFFNPEILHSISERLDYLLRDFSYHFHVGNRTISPEAQGYLSGLLMKAPRKNMERMEEYVKECDYESIQHFISESPWNHKTFITHVANEVNEIIGSPDSVLAIDESGFTKKGNKSVGVSRQYNGRLGKIDNCQVGVFGALTDGERVSLIDVRLYLPKEWIESQHRCDIAGIPEKERIFKSKPELGIEIVDDAIKNGLQFGWVGFDGFYGNIPEFLQRLEEKKQKYVGAVHKDQTVFTEPPLPYLPRRTEGKGRKYSRYKTNATGIRVDIINEQNVSPWHLITIREGTNGYVGYQARRMRVWLWEEDTNNVNEVWFLVLKDPYSNELKYYLSNAEKTVSLTKIVKKAAWRFFIERAFQDAKTSLGMADYQMRVWTGWYHHMAMVLLAMLFLLKERILNKENMPLLSCQDIVEVLNHYLPRGDLDVKDVFEHLENRHEKRQRAIDNAYTRQFKKNPNLFFNLTK